MSSPSVTPTRDNCHLFRLPLELRDRIYENLLSIKHTTTPKDLEAGLRSTTRYDWNIDPTILRVNHQISREAKELFGRNNKFVVIERSQLLEPLESQMEDDPANEIYNIKMWPGKKVKTADVPGVMMRVRLTKDLGASDQSAELDMSVVLVEELYDLCTSLSLLLEADGTYQTAGILACVQFLGPASKKTSQERDNIRTALSRPLAQFRHFRDIEVVGMSRVDAMTLLGSSLSKNFDAVVLKTTINDLIFSGDQARQRGHFDVATVYFQRAYEFFEHCMPSEATFNNHVETMAIEFKIMQHRALNWIEAGDFDNAENTATMALDLSESLFQTLNADDPNSAQANEPRKNVEGVVTVGAMREWRCRCIKEGAEKAGQRIKAEDVGRVFYYKSIAEHILGGKAMKKEAEEDKMMGIGCCVVSDTIGQENIPKELLEFDIKIMEGLKSAPTDDDEWEDESEWGDDDEWEDEDE